MNQYQSADYTGSLARGLSAGMAMGGAIKQGIAEAGYSNARDEAIKTRDEAIKAAGSDQKAIDLANQNYSKAMDSAYETYAIGSGNIKDANDARLKSERSQWTQEQARAAFSKQLEENPQLSRQDAINSVSNGYMSALFPAQYGLGQDGSSVTIQRPGEPLQTVNLSPEQWKTIDNKWIDKQMTAAGFGSNPTEPASEASSGAQATTAQEQGTPEQAITQQQMQEGVVNQGQPQSPVQQPQGQAMQTPQQAKAQQAQTVQVRKAEAKFNKQAVKELGPEPTGKRGETLEYIQERERKMYDLSLKYFQRFGELPPWANVGTLLNVAKAQETETHNINTENLKHRENELRAGTLSETRRHHLAQEEMWANNARAVANGKPGKYMLSSEPTPDTQGKLITDEGGIPVASHYMIKTDAGYQQFIAPVGMSMATSAKLLELASQQVLTDKNGKPILNAEGQAQPLFGEPRTVEGRAMTEFPLLVDPNTGKPFADGQIHTVSAQRLGQYLGLIGKKKGKAGAKADGATASGNSESGAIDKRWQDVTSDEDVENLIYGEEGGESDTEASMIEAAKRQIAEQTAPAKDPNELGSSVVNSDWKAQQSQQPTQTSPQQTKTEKGMKLAWEEEYDPYAVDSTEEEDVPRNIAEEQNRAADKAIAKGVTNVSKSISGSDAELRQQEADMKPYPGDSSASERMVRRMTHDPKHAEYRTQHGHDGSNVPVQYSGDEMKPAPEKSTYEKAKEIVSTARGGARSASKAVINTVKEARDEAKKSADVFEDWLDSLGAYGKRALEENTKVVNDSAMRGQKALYSSGQKAKEVLSTPYKNAKKSLDEFGEDLDRGGRRVYKAIDKGQKSLHNASTSAKDAVKSVVKPPLDEFGDDLNRGGKRVYEAVDNAQKSIHKAMSPVRKVTRSLRKEPIPMNKDDREAVRQERIRNAGRQKQAAARVKKDNEIAAFYAKRKAELENESLRSVAGKYNTKLSPADERAFQQDVKKAKREMDLIDYDLRGYWKELKSKGQTLSSAKGHFPDKYKKPNHPTFSEESIYDGRGGMKGGKWTQENGQWVYTPGMRLTAPAARALLEYFRKHEPTARLNLKNRIVGKNDSAMIVSTN